MLDALLWAHNACPGSPLPAAQQNFEERVCGLALETPGINFVLEGADPRHGKTATLSALRDCSRKKATNYEN